jgi:hypothetical protein
MRHLARLGLVLLAWHATTLAAEPGVADGAMTTKAAKSLLERIEIHGFAAQAAVRTSANRFFGDSPNTSFEFTQLGLNASLRAKPRLLFAGQVLLRSAGDMYAGSPSLDYLLADIGLDSSTQRIAGIRLGRIKTRAGLYNETRDVPFTHPGIFLPQTVYFDKTRNLLLSSDGAQVYADWFSKAGQVSLVASIGRAIMDENVEWAFLGGDFDGDLVAERPLVTASLWYQDVSERFTLGLSTLATQLHFEAGPASPIGAGNLTVSYNIASLEYNARDWTLTSELMLMPLPAKGFDVPLLDRNNTVAGWYLQGVYRLHPRLQLLARYERGVADLGDPDGSDQSIATGGLTPASDFTSDIWSAGLRWDITSSIMLRADYQRHIGTFDLSIRENPDPAQLRKHWDLIAIEIALRF